MFLSLAIVDVEGVEIARFIGCRSNCLVSFCLYLLVFRIIGYIWRWSDIVRVDLFLGFWDDIFSFWVIWIVCRIEDKDKAYRFDCGTVNEFFSRNLLTSWQSAYSWQLQSDRETHLKTQHLQHKAQRVVENRKDHNYTIVYRFIDLKNFRVRIQIRIW